MTITEAVDYVYASYLKAQPYLQYDAPDREKRDPGLTRAILEHRSSTPTVLVTGSKGKGSVSKMIADIMGVHCRVGLMTSPHILSFNERFQIQGEPVSDKQLAEAISLVKPEFDKIEKELTRKQYISPMGIQTAAALELFKNHGVEFQVLECGKGVAYDDVGNVPHKYGVVNHIFLEHTRELGGTIEEIAANKAAVITGAECAVFTSRQSSQVMEILEQRAAGLKVPLYQYGRDFWCENISYTPMGMKFDVVVSGIRFDNLIIPLLGTYQAENCALAMAVCVKELGALNMDAVKSNLKSLEWPGRLEILCSQPLVLLDACINRASCENVKEALEKLGVEQVTTIIGIPKDKDFLGVAEEMKEVSKDIILTRSQNPHYVFEREQVEILKKTGIESWWAEDISEAMDLAWQQGNPICILGTTSLISDVKRLAATPRLL